MIDHAAPPCVAPWQAAPFRLWSLLEMLRTYMPIYQIARELQRLVGESVFLKGSKIYEHDRPSFDSLLASMQTACEERGMSHTAEMARRAAERKIKTYDDIRHVLTHLNDSLTTELEREMIVRIPPERTGYYEQDDAFGPDVAAAFPSCAPDIRKAGSCYALAQEDACVHHLMLVLERGLNALAAKVGVPYLRTNWQDIINNLTGQLKSSIPKGPQRDFYLEVTAQFGFLKEAYRNHAEHARDTPYDMEKALSIYNHVRAFMQELAKGGLTE